MGYKRDLRNRCLKSRGQERKQASVEQKMRKARVQGTGAEQVPGEVVTHSHSTWGVKKHIRRAKNEPFNAQKGRKTRPATTSRTA
jgi:hypothetical protein